MRVTCKCFGIYKGVEARRSPFIDEGNVVEFIEKNQTFEVEHCMYNDIFFKIKEKDLYVLSWLRTNDGLIDYVCNRGELKAFSKKTILKDAPPKYEVICEETLNKGLANLSITSSKPAGRYKKERIPATVRNIVWVTHFQSSKKGQCWLCKVEDISSANFECGHVISERHGGKSTIDNLRPICGFCNKSVGTMNMEDFKKKYNIP